MAALRALLVSLVIALLPHVTATTGPWTPGVPAHAVGLVPVSGLTGACDARVDILFETVQGSHGPGNDAVPGYGNVTIDGPCASLRGVAEFDSCWCDDGESWDMWVGLLGKSMDVGQLAVSGDSTFDLWLDNVHMHGGGTLDAVAITQKSWATR